MPQKPPVARPFVPLLTALLAVTLAGVGMYTGNFIHAIRMSIGVPRRDYAVFFAYAAGMGLGAALLPKVMRQTWLPAAILAAAFAVRLPGIDAWEYSSAREHVISMGHGFIAAGVFILFFSVVPPGKRGFWYGCGLSVSFLWWRVMQTMTHGAPAGPEAAERYARLYTIQTVTLFLMTGLLILGLSKIPPSAAIAPPETAAPEAKQPEPGRILRFAGALFLFYLANGFLGARLSPAISNANAENVGDGAWTGHILIILACPLFGLFLDRRRDGDGAKKLMLAASVFLMLAPPLNVLSGSPLLYSAIVSLGSLAQFAMLMTAIIMFAGMGTGPGWFGAAALFQFSLRFVSFLMDSLWQKMPETEDGVAVFLATAAAVGFHFAARNVRFGNDGPVENRAPDSPITAPAAVPDPSQKYALTPRESEVLALFIGGKSTEEISRQLFISKFTVRKHFQSIMAKAGVSNRNALLIKVLQAD